ncbi:MAG: Hsp20/alpha crystallin family protein [Deltaproteobacteria bacterium]|nr:Hsp20/alpha crystallin family protein [Deltaproteobacteria bacterium]
MAKHDSAFPLPTQLVQEVDRLFDELIHRPWGFRRPAVAMWKPEIDLYETAVAFIVEVDLPGIREEDVEVTVDNGDLVLRGTRTVLRTATQGNFHYQERHSGDFSRRVRLPASVDQTRIHAEVKHGVLRVTLPKTPRERNVS